MEAVAEKKVGNPNFGKTAQKKQEFDPEKMYEFELIQTYEKYKPTDEQGNKVANLYPPVFSLPNKTICYDEDKKKQRAIRYINSESSIFVDEQREMETEEEVQLLTDSDNFIEFKDGKLVVRGVDLNKIKYLTALDMFEGKKVQVKANTVKAFRLINPDQVIEAALNSLDTSYEAEKAARESTEEEMYAAAYLMGIDLEQGSNGVKRDFIMQAKANPDFFVKHIVDPKNKFVYTFAKALKKNIINVNLENGNVHFTESNAFITKVNPREDIAAELAKKAIVGDEGVTKAYSHITKL